MRHLRMLGLAAFAAMGLMAFIGASSASATALCTTTDTPSCSMAYPTGTVIKSRLKPGTTAKLTDSGGNVIATCTGSNVTAKTTNESGAKITGTINEWTWSGCSQSTASIATGSFTTEYISGTHKGTSVSAGNESTTIIFGVSCTYGDGAGTDFGGFGEGSTTTVTKTAGGFLCPSTAGWDAEFEVIEPHAIFVTEN